MAAACARARRRPRAASQLLIRSDGTREKIPNSSAPCSVETFTTVSTAPVPATTLSGVLADPGPYDQPGTRDDYQTDPSGVYGSTATDYLRPIQGVQLYLLGMESNSAAKLKTYTCAAIVATLSPVLSHGYYPGSY